jgi:hypothetical protein
MPIAAIEITKLFCGHWVRHFFDLSVIIYKYKTFHLKSQVENDRIELSISACKAPVIPFN